MQNGADDGIGALPHIDSFINEVIHSSGKRLTAHSEYSTLSRTGLKRVIGIKHLWAKTGVVLAGLSACGGGR